MKRIAIFCDGTWNSADQTHPTNVRQLAVMIPARGADGVDQKALYFNGVGVPERGGWLERINEKISGGAMGWGLDDKIAVAYLHLGRLYQPGDQVYIFGFSRGAYTARSLAGLIRNAGLPRDPSNDLVRDCFDLYRDPTDDTKPDAPKSLAFRLRVSPHLTTSAAEVAFRRTGGHPQGAPFGVTYMGVWDTVGALGIPSHWGMPARLLNRRYRFHDTDLSSMVKAARHAVAIDEHRLDFVPTLWTNLDRLRAETRGDYRQEWFAGDHGSVGGGGDIVGLSNIALLWMAAGAMAEGLSIPGGALDALRPGANPLGPLRNRSAPPGLGDRFLGLASGSRDAPSALADVSHPVIRRWRTDRDFPQWWNGRPYRPKTLAPLEPGLAGFDLAQITDYAAPTRVA